MALTFADITFAGVTVEYHGVKWGQQAIFGYGITGQATNTRIFNKVSNTGVVATNTTGTGNQRSYVAACGYGGDKGIFGYGGSGVVILRSKEYTLDYTGSVTVTQIGEYYIYKFTGNGTIRFSPAA